MFRKYTLSFKAVTENRASSIYAHYVLFTFVDAMKVNSRRVGYFEDSHEADLWLERVKPDAFDRWDKACIYKDGVLVDLKGV